MASTDTTNQNNGGLDETTDPVLKVSGLTKIYDDQTLAVDDIDFQVANGDFCVVIGPSGCGKSTTLHSLVGKVEPTDGTIWLADKDITDSPTYERDIGLVFQDFQLFPHLSVRENIKYGLDRLGESGMTKKVDNLVEIMKLEDLADRKPEELSAGQKQRVALARSLVLEPELLLLDEPLGDLDYKLQKRMERELLRLHRQLDTTFIYVTHDQTQAMRLADQIVVMNDGKVEQSGTVDEVYNHPETAFVAAFLGDSNIFFGEITDVDDGVAIVESEYGSFQASTTNLDSQPESVVGQEMPLFVRPQHVSLDSDACNTIDCRVEDVIYQPGSGTQIVLTTVSDGKELQLKTPDAIEDVPERVTVGWSSEHTTLLERTSVVSTVNLEKDILGE
ncbi:ABC transporter ATP-binding protein [Haladaptatus sp. CMAA 1911]|uniref:ABC transporter ATP-binding protein n=1 Tax=unclassified Haladaptatus TaxID=2622732 RepID=UPI0037548559